jgi:lipid II:glycine glycyltransferase (peptidoglycan interpeptide bridge formation enzyme)
MKITFGPVLDYSNSEHLKAALLNIIETVKKSKALYIQVHPFIWNIDLEKVRNTFYSNGFNRVKFYIYEATMMINLAQTEEEIFKNFESRGKEAVRQSIRRGITAKQVEINTENIKIFYNLYFNTCKRTEMIPESFETISNILNKFENEGKVFLFMSFFEKRAVSTFIAYDCGDCLSLIYQGSDYDEEIQKKRPANGLYWETIKWAKKNSYKWFDLAGVNANPKPGSKSEGIRLYKRQFGCAYFDFPGNFEYVNRPLLKNIIDFILPIYSKYKLKRQRKIVYK